MPIIISGSAGSSTFSLSGSTTVTVFGEVLAQLSGSQIITGSLDVSEELRVAGATNLSGNVTLGNAAGDTLTVNAGQLRGIHLSGSGRGVLGQLTIFADQNSADATGQLNVSGSMQVNRGANFNAGAKITGSVGISSGLNVFGATNLSGNVAIENAKNLTLHGGHLSGSGRGVLGQLTIFADMNSADATGQLNVSGSMQVNRDANFNAGAKITGSVGISSGLNVWGTTNLSGNVTLGNAGTDIVTSTAQLSASQGLYSAYKVGIGTAAPKVVLDVHYTGSLDPTLLPNDTSGGDVVFFGTSSAALAAGALYYLNANGGWLSASADATGSGYGIPGGHNQLLGISVGTRPNVDGMLVKGYADINTYLSGAFVKGAAVYICHTANSRMTCSAPGAAPLHGGHVTAAEHAFVRQVGYCTDTGNVIYFDPSSTYVEIDASEE